jgi:hypothetical protein
MTHFGIATFVDQTRPQAPERRDANAEALKQRAESVGIANANEEEQSRIGPACDQTSCRIPDGVTLGNGPFPIPVAISIAFDPRGSITAFEVGFDRVYWSAMRDLLDSRYGDDWRVEERDDVTADFRTKKAHPDHVISLTHRASGTNPKNGNQCTIKASSRDSPFLHSTAPIYRAKIEIRLIPRSF